MTTLHAEARRIALKVVAEHDANKHWQQDAALPVLARAFLEATEWRPIENAPRDGTPILCWCPNNFQGKGGIWVMVWVEGAWHHIGSFADKPTHWLPLPSAPEGK